MWGSTDKQAILPTTKHSGNMVREFIDEHNGYLPLLPEELTVVTRSDPDFTEEAREPFEYGTARAGYWTAEKLVPNCESHQDCRVEISSCNGHNCVAFL